MNSSLIKELKYSLKDIGVNDVEILNTYSLKDANYELRKKGATLITRFSKDDVIIILKFLDKKKALNFISKNKYEEFPDFITNKHHFSVLY